MNRRRFLSCALVPFVPAAAAGVYIGMDGADASGRAAWARLMITDKTEALIAAFYRANETMRLAARAMWVSEGAVIALPDGSNIVSPYLAIEKRAAKQAEWLENMLGYTPARKIA